MNCSLSTLRMEDVVNGTLHRRVADVEQRLSAIEARTQAEPPKPEREPGWYVVQRKGKWSPSVLWWNGAKWQFGPPDALIASMRATADWISHRLDIPAEKVTP